MRHDVMDAMKEEMAEWRTLLGELRVKTSLGKMELRDKLDAFEKAYENARNRLGEWKHKGGIEWDASKAALETGWESLRDTYQEVKKQRRDH